MTYRLEYHALVVKQDIPKLDQMMRKRIKKAIEQKLLIYPEIFGIPLRHSRDGHRKLRVGDYRVVFVLKQKLVRILLIEHRSVVYGVLKTRGES